MPQNQIGGNTTSASPFVTAAGVVYFRGTDNKLWRVNGDSTDQFQIGTNTTKSTPCVFADPIGGEWVYFQGTDDKLWKVRGDAAGTNLTQIGTNKTKSTPFVTYDSSTGDDKLWKVRADSSGSNLTQIGTNTTSSSPFAIFDATTSQVWLYFQGTDSRLLKVRNDGAGSGFLNIGNNRTKATPCVTSDGWVYFQGTDNRLLKVFNDGTQGSQIGGNTTSSMPKVRRIPLADGTVEEWIYFQGTNNDLWRYFETVGGKLGPFSAMQNGWHFDNDFVNKVFHVLTTHGLCGGMAYSALDYYFNDLPIPTHRVGDFGANVTVPPEGRLHSMIYNRLIDSFADNFGKWSCVYPELDAAVGAALGLVVGGGLLGAVVGAVWGGVYGELHEVFSCPSGGPAGMTRQELPNLTGNFLDKKIPVPIGLIFDSDILNIGQSHQVVAYGYSRNGTMMTINIYDNRFHDEECTLVLDSSNPGVIKEYSVTNNNKDLGSWAGLLVSDGYQPQWPSYGPDISIASPQSLQLTGPVVTGPVSVLPQRPVANARRAPVGSSLTFNQILMAAQQIQPVRDTLGDSFSVQNYGEFPAHYASLGVEIEGPGASDSFALAPAFAGDNTLAPGATAPVNLRIADFGSTPGLYSLIAGFNTVPAGAGAGGWMRILYPPASVTVSSIVTIQTRT